MVYFAVLTVSPKEIRVSLEGNRGIARTMRLCQNCVICGKWNNNFILFLFYIKNSKAIDYDQFLFALAVLCFVELQLIQYYLTCYGNTF